MPATLDAVAHDALILPPDQRLALARQLLASVDLEPEPGAEAAWEAEIVRRIARFKAAAIAPRAGHPQIRTVSINSGRLAGECTKTFASMPRLTNLHIENQLFEGEVWLTPERKQAMKGEPFGPGAAGPLPQGYCHFCTLCLSTSKAVARPPRAPSSSRKSSMSVCSLVTRG